MPLGVAVYFSKGGEMTSFVRPTRMNLSPQWLTTYQTVSTGFGHSYLGYKCCSKITILYWLNAMSVEKMKH